GGEGGWRVGGRGSGRRWGCVERERERARRGSGSAGGGMNEPVRSSIGWYACRTRPRAEKQVGRLLRLRRVESYVPLLEQVRQWTDRKKRVGFPLFPGYVFARFSLAMVHEVLRTPGIVTIVRNHAGPAPDADD